MEVLPGFTRFNASFALTTVNTPKHLPDLAEMELPDLEAFLEQLGTPRFHARQVFRWIYRRDVSAFAEMTDLGRALRDRLATDVILSTPRLVHRDTSTDGTVKLLLQLADGRRIESVFIPDTPAMTFCVS